MTPHEQALALGITFPKLEKGYLNLVARSGNLLFVSGHVSTLKGKLGAGVATANATRTQSVQTATRNESLTAVLLLLVCSRAQQKGIPTRSQRL